MNTILNVLLNLLRIIEAALIARCILSFITSLHDNRIVKFIYWMTEPVLYPARYILKKFMPGDASPIDLSILLTFLSLIVIRLLIGNFI